MWLQLLKWVLKNLLWDAVRAVFIAVSTGLSGYWAYLDGQPRWVIALVSLGAFLLATLILSVIQHLWIKSKNPHPGALTSDKCPDAWLHRIAEEQRQDIDVWVTVSRVDWNGADLFRGRPYLQFLLLIDNSSVYRISLDDPTGYVDYAGEPISGTLQFADNKPSELQSGAVNVDYTLHLTIDDSDDVKRILNVNSGFVFKHVNIKFQAKERDVGQRFLRIADTLDIKWLRDKYPKLRMEILDAEILDFLDFDSSDVIKYAGSVVNVKMKFENRDREFPARIRSFKLDTSPDLVRITISAVSVQFHSTGHRRHVST
jgi:hypothetical protein